MDKKILIKYEQELANKKNIPDKEVQNLLDTVHKLVSTHILKKELYPNLQYGFSSNREAILHYDRQNILSVLVVSLSLKDLIQLLNDKKIDIFDYDFPPSMEDWMRNVYGSVKNKKMYKFLNIPEIFEKGIQKLIADSDIPNLMKYYRKYIYDNSKYEIFK